jgi:calcium-dependent protein kinase
VTHHFKRPTAAQAMEHKWITMHSDPDEAKINSEKPSLLQASHRSTTFQKYLALQKLKKAALVVIASNLTHDQVGSLGDIFRRIDQTGDGTMTLTELDNAISRGNFSKDIQVELSAMKEELALSDSDTLNWKAFLAAAMDKNLVLREDKIKLAFDHFKHSDTDYLTLDDFKPIFESEGQALEVFNYLDTDQDGKVSFEDFRCAMEESVDYES